MRKEEMLDLSFGILCGYKIKIDGKFIQRTTFSFSTDSLLRYFKPIYYNFHIILYTYEYKTHLFLSKKLFAKCLFEDF